MIKPNKISLWLLIVCTCRLCYAQCPTGTVVTVTNNLGNNSNGSFAWALDCLDNVGSTLTTVRFDLDGSTEIQPSAAAPLVVNKSGATIDGANTGSGGPVIIDGTSVAGPAPNGLILAQTNVTVQGLIIRNFTASGGGNGILANGTGANIQNNTTTGNRIGIATGSAVFTFSITGNSVGDVGAGNTVGGISITGAPSNGVISGNEIAGNSGAGINIVGGTVLISNNSIYCNTGSGITRPAPPLAPVITLATTQLVRGTAEAGRVIEVFLYSTAGCSGTPVQGRTLLGTVTTPGTGIWTLPLVAGSVAPGNQVTATSTQNANNTSVFSAPVTVADCAAFVAGSNQTNVLCPGGNSGSATATPVNSAFTYLWTTGETTSTISSLFAGTYTVTVTNNTGCSASQTVTITEPAALTLTVLPVHVSCFGGSNGTATATPGGGTPGYNLVWSNGQTTNTITGLAVGIYSVTVTDQNNCTTTRTTTITQPTALSLAIVPNSVACFGGNTGSAVATAGGGIPGYNYSWSNGQTTLTAANLVAGPYVLTVTDQNNCTIVQSTSIGQPTQLTLNISFTNETSLGAADGSATALPNGGTPVYSYLWNTGSTTAQIANLASGTYTVTVTDQNNCTTTRSATVATGPGGGGGCTALPVYAVLAPAQVCGNTTFTIEADDLYPNAAVTYVWHLPNNDSMLTTQPMLELTATSSAFSGEYFVLRDSAGCRSIAVGGAPVTILAVDNVSAGTGAVLCSAAPVQLTAGIPASGTGSWVSLGAATVDNTAQNQTMARNLQSGRNVFVWQVALGNCLQAGTDTVVYFLENKPVVQDDHYTLQHAFDVAVMEVLLNDALSGLPDTMLLQLNAPATGQLELISGARRFRYEVAEDFRGSVSFQYAVCSPATVCNLPCDTATVTIDVQNLPTVPEGLVLEDPGPNGALTIRGVNGFTRVEISIFDRWGDLVFQETDYDNSNPWAGNYKRTAQYLPGGAYYFFLKAYDGQTQIGGTLTGVIHLFDQ